MSQGHLPHEHETARTHQREILRCAVIVAIARQQQQLAAQELHDQAQSQLVDMLPDNPEDYPTVGNIHLNTEAMLRTTAELDAAVDQLTNACIAAQIASKAGGN
jgi:hypothetical protein